MATQTPITKMADQRETHKNQQINGLSTYPALQTKVQESLLAHGTNFAVAPRHPPYLEYMAIEQVCNKLKQQEVVELRLDISRVLKSSQPPKPNISKAEYWAMQQLKMG